jgi:hypothetical protein
LMMSLICKLRATSTVSLSHFHKTACPQTSVTTSVTPSSVSTEPRIPPSLWLTWPWITSTTWIHNLSILKATKSTEEESFPLHRLPLQVMNQSLTPQTRRSTPRDLTLWLPKTPSQNLS